MALADNQVYQEFEETRETQDCLDSRAYQDKKEKMACQDCLD